MRTLEIHLLSPIHRHEGHSCHRWHSHALVQLKMPQRLPIQLTRGASVISPTFRSLEPLGVNLSELMPPEQSERKDALLASHGSRPATA